MSLDRIFQGLKEIIRAQFPNYDYQCLWEYKVASVSQGPPVVIDAQSTTTKMPDLTGLVMRPGSCGCVSTPKQGASILVGFVNADPTRPYVHGVDPASNVDKAMLPADVEIDLSGGGQGCARILDTVNCGYLVQNLSNNHIDSYWPGTPVGLTNANARVAALSPNGLLIAMGDTIDGLHPGPGTIVTGSGKVKVGG